MNLRLPARLYNGQPVYSLETHPNRCPVSLEARKLKLKLRHLLYGKKTHVYRIIDEVEEQRQAVRVPTILHGARKKLKHLILTDF
jgi:hypothetical protein